MASTDGPANNIPEGNGVDFKYHIPLYRAALKGDLESAKSFFQRDPEAVTARITDKSWTALHVAACTRHPGFVEELVRRMPAEALALQDHRGDTALHLAAIAGITRTLKALVGKNPALPQVRDNNGRTPLGRASTFANLEKKEAVWYLCLVTRDEDRSPFTGTSGAEILCDVTKAGLYDIALHLVRRYPNLAITPIRNNTLQVMAKKPSAFPSGSRLGFCQRCIYSFAPSELANPPRRSITEDMEEPPESYGDLAGVSIRVQSRSYLSRVFQWWNRLLWKAIEQLIPGIKQVSDAKLRHIHSLELVKCIFTHIQSMSNPEITNFLGGTNIMWLAAKFGTIEILMEYVKCFPDEIWTCKNNRHSIFHIAVEHRQEKIFNLIYGRDARTTILLNHRDRDDNTILHLAAKLAPSPQLNSVSGAALQMQRELQWFKEVEKIVRLSYKDCQNAKGETAQVLFTKEHKELAEKGEKWMKDTATACMLVATLVATIVFAAAFTVPGGNENDRGIRIFLKTNSFKVFIASDALALFSAATSVLMFLSILTSRYAEEYFLKSLPTKLILGLAFLFFSIATMMIAFSAALSIIFSERWAWVALTACFPVTLFAFLQFPSDPGSSRKIVNIGYPSLMKVKRNLCICKL